MMRLATVRRTPAFDNRSFIPCGDVQGADDNGNMAVRVLGRIGVVEKEDSLVGSTEKERTRPRGDTPPDRPGRFRRRGGGGGTTGTVALPTSGCVE